MSQFTQWMWFGIQSVNEGSKQPAESDMISQGAVWPYDPITGPQHLGDYTLKSKTNEIFEKWWDNYIKPIKNNCYLHVGNYLFPS